MSKIASLTLLVVGTGWMNQTISMQGTVEMLRPYESAAEALDSADAIRAELLTSPSLGPVEGLYADGADFGDFASITDVRITYLTREFRTDTGFFGSQDTAITTREEIADFRNDDSFGVVSDEED